MKKLLLAVLMAATAATPVMAERPQRGERSPRMDRPQRAAPQPRVSAPRATPRATAPRPSAPRAERAVPRQRPSGDYARQRSAPRPDASVAQRARDVYRGRGDGAAYRRDRSPQRGIDRTPRPGNPAVRTNPGVRPDARRDQRDWRQDRRDDRRDWRTDRRDDRRDWRTDRRDDRRDWRQDRRADRRDDRRDWRQDRRWDRNWRQDRRYDWQRYRSSNRHVYRLPRYYAPHGWHYGYRRYSTGIYLSAILFGSSYWINDPWYYRLPPAYGDYRWVRYYDDVLLVDVRTGYVVDVIHDFFY